MSKDFHDKTENPTPKKLEDARKKGYIAKSHDLTVSLLLVLTMGLLFFSSGYMFFRLKDLILNVLINLNLDISDPNLLEYGLRLGLIKIFWLLFPVLLGVVLFAFLLNIVQTKGIFSLYPLMPQWGRINPFNGSNYERNFSVKALVRLGFGLIRINMVVILSLVIMAADAFRIFSLSKGNAMDVLLYIRKQATLVGVGIAISYVAVGVMDFFYQRWLYNREMKMSRKEIRDEVRQLEGDVNMKIKIKNAMRSFISSGLLKLIPHADAIITDENRMVVAIGYKPEKMKAPVILAKGIGRKARNILVAAQKHGIPRLEDPELAKSLFYRSQAEGALKPELFHPVAMALAKIRRIDDFTENY